MAPFPSFADAPWFAGQGSALVLGARAWTYDALSDLIGERESVLRCSGVRAGQVVMAPDAPACDLILMQHALARMGAALFPVRAGTEPGIMDDLIAGAGVEWTWDPSVESLRATGCRKAACENRPTSLALLIKTSGSSGRPKIAMLTPSNVLASALETNAALGLAPGDIWLACLRPSHIGGVSIAYRCALAGATLLLQEGFVAEAVASGLNGMPVTHLSLVPPMLARLLDLGCRPPSSLRVAMIGGQALSLSLAQRALDAGWPLHISYGMTETGSQIATTPRLSGRIRETSLVGRPMRELEMDLGGCGERPRRLRIRGSVVMAGYANPERRPGDGIEDGWFEAADLACFTDEGQLRILGRADDVLVVGGANVSRARIEAELSRMPGIGDVLIVDLPDPVWGHRLVAVYSGAVSALQVETWCGAHLTGPERPRAFKRLSPFPLLDSGKLDRRGIADLVRSADPG
ncbi:AMP-binding protein [Imhoffiella purpurea]|uniref:O-succinylbenzoic acid--CoA ligase n=1 Tax=Imhoffiella purpurea TaxID=1249627 RepID=W9V7J4_9GAMM|nr:AMP-binding protein [Imhoffiella purpurea]EXJ15548.1 O-succinylbenzoic acid--CoA ligase [Imhoffiella purpurea]